MAMKVTYPPLVDEHRPGICTAQAAFYLSRSPQTLRLWACSESGAVRPSRLNGRLMWPVKDIKRILNVA